MSFADPFSSRFEVFGREATPRIDDINQGSFDRLKRFLDLGDGGDGRVILLRAPRAGYGKTSVLQRLATEFADTHQFVRINLVGGRHTDAARVLEYVLQSLCHVLPESTTLTDLDLLARRILALGLEPLVASGEVPCQDRDGALAALREQPTETFDFHHDRAVTAHWTKSNFEILGPRLAAELACISGASLREASYWVELLFRFATTAPDNVERSRLLFETVFRSDLQNQSESAAEERLHGLLALLGAVTRLVLIVDDTEGLSAHPPDALELASFLANVSQSCPGTLVLLSVNTDVWETAFLPLLPGGLADRLTEYTVSLEPLTDEQARDLVRSRAGDRADEVIEKIAWPEGDLFARQVLKAASEAWDTLEDASSLKVVAERKEFGRDSKAFTKSSNNLDDLPEDLDDDEFDNDADEAGFGAPAASPFRAGKASEPFAGETADDEDAQDEDEEQFAGAVGEDLRAPSESDKSDEEEALAEAATVKADESHEEDLAAVSETSDGAASEEEPNPESAAPVALSDEEKPSGESAAPFAAFGTEEEDEESAADMPAGAESDAIEIAAGQGAEEDADLDTAPLAADEMPKADSPAGAITPPTPANPFTAVAASPSSSPFSAASAAADAPESAADAENDGEPEVSSTAGGTAGGDPVRPFADSSEPPLTDGETTESPFEPKASIPEADDDSADFEEPTVTSDDAVTSDADSSDEQSAPAPSGDSFGTKPEAAHETPAPAANPFASAGKPASQSSPQPPVSPFSATRAGSAASPFSPAGGSPAAPSEAPESGPSGLGQESTTTPAEPSSATEPPVPDKPAITPPPLPPESPFSTGSSPASQPAPAGPSSPPPLSPSQPPANSPFAGMGGSTAGEKNLGEVSSIFDPIRPENDFSIDPAKLKPLLDRADHSTPEAPPAASPFAAGSASPPASSPAPQSATGDSSSPFKPVASTPEESPFSSSANQTKEPSDFGGQSYRGLKDSAPPNRGDEQPAAESPHAESPSETEQGKEQPTSHPVHGEGKARLTGGQATAPEPDEDDPSPFTTKPAEEADEPSAEEQPASSFRSSLQSPFRPAAQQASHQPVSPFAKGAAESLPQGLATPRTELPPKQLQPPAESQKPEPASPFETGTSPVESPPAPKSAIEKPDSESKDDESSPFAAVGESSTEEFSSFSVPATSRPPDQDKVDELLRQFKARYAND